MKKTYFAPQVKVVAIDSNCILAGSDKTLTGGNKVGEGNQLSKKTFLDLNEFDSEE